MQQQLHLTNCTSTRRIQARPTWWSTTSHHTANHGMYSTANASRVLVGLILLLSDCSAGCGCTAPWWQSQPAPEGHSRGRECGSLERGGAGGGGANTALATAGQQGAAERGGGQRHAHMVSQHKLPPKCLFKRLFVSATQYHPAPLHAMHQRCCKDMVAGL
jgi:hypothetical protein